MHRYNELLACQVASELELCQLPDNRSDSDKCRLPHPPSPPAISVFSEVGQACAGQGDRHHAFGTAQNTPGFNIHKYVAPAHLTQ